MWVEAPRPLLLRRLRAPATRDPRAPPCQSLLAEEPIVRACLVAVLVDKAPGGGRGPGRRRSPPDTSRRSTASKARGGMTHARVNRRDKVQIWCAFRRDAARRGRVRQAGQVATTAQRARPDAPPASPRRLFGESRTPTSSAACARVGSSRRVDGFTRRPSASSVSTPRRGVPPRRSRAVIGPVRLHSSMPIVQARRFRVDPSASETRKVVGEGAAPTSRASEGGTIVYVAPVSTRNRTLALRRAKTRAST